METVEEEEKRLLRQYYESEGPEAWESFAAFAACVSDWLVILAGLRLRLAGVEGPAAVEDVTADTLEKVRGSKCCPSCWDIQRPLRPWLRTILRNTVLDLLRKRGHEPASLDAACAESLEDDMPSPESIILASEVCGVLRLAVEELGEPHRQIVIASYYDRKTLAEVGADLGYTAPWVYQERKKALQTLKDALAGSGYPEIPECLWDALRFADEDSQVQE